MTELNETAEPWSALELVREAGGFRHYLEGIGIHCGNAVELQTVERCWEDLKGHLRPLPRGVLVCYEARQLTGELEVSLHSEVAGYPVTLMYTDSMRFRWPLGAGR